MGGKRGELEFIPIIDAIAAPGVLFLVCWSLSRRGEGAAGTGSLARRGSLASPSAPSWNQLQEMILELQALRSLGAA